MKSLNLMCLRISYKAKSVMDKLPVRLATCLFRGGIFGAVLTRGVRGNRSSVRSCIPLNLHRREYNILCCFCRGRSSVSFAVGPGKAGSGRRVWRTRTVEGSPGRSASSSPSASNRNERGQSKRSSAILTIQASATSLLTFPSARDTPLSRRSRAPQE